MNQLFEQIESDGFSAVVNVASDIRQFTKALVATSEVRQLFDRESAQGRRVASSGTRSRVGS